MIATRGGLSLAAVFVVFVSAASAGPGANEGMTYTHHLALSGEGAVIGLTDWDVVIAVVKAVSPGEATNGKPGECELEVIKVLRGDPKAARTKAVIEPFPHDVDYGDIENSPQYKAWAATPLAKPKVGENLLLVGELWGEGQEKAFSVSPLGNFPYSEEKRTWALKLIRQGAVLREAQAKQAALEAEKLREAKADWERVSQARIDRFVRESDLIVVGPASREYIGVNFPSEAKVSDVLKGRLRGAENRPPPQVNFVVPGYCRGLVKWREQAYVFFLAEHGAEWSGRGSGAPWEEFLEYRLIAPGVGFLPATAANVSAVKDAVARGGTSCQPLPIAIFQYINRASFANVSATDKCFSRIVAALLEEGKGRCTILVRSVGLDGPPGRFADRTAFHKAAAGATFSLNVEAGALASEPYRLRLVVRQLIGDAEEVVDTADWIIRDEGEAADRAEARRVIDMIVQNAARPRVAVRREESLGTTTGDLIRRLNEACDRIPFPSSADSLVRELAACGPAVIAPLLESATKNRFVAPYAGEVFALMEPQARPALLEALRKNQDNVFDILVAMGQSVLPTVRELLSDRDVAMTALSLIDGLDLGPQAPSWLAERLNQLLRDPEATARLTALRCVSRFQGDSITRTVLSVFERDSETYVRNEALGWLGATAAGMEGQDPLLRSIVTAMATAAERDRDKSIRVAAIESLATLGVHAAPAGPVLFRAAQDKDDDVRRAAREALRETDLLFQAMEGADPRAVAALRALLGHRLSRYISERTTADIAAQVNELVRLGPANYPAVITMLRYGGDDQPWSELEEVLGRWGKEILPDIGKLVRTEKDPIVRSAVASAIGWMTLEEFPAELEVLINDEDCYVRDAAFSAVCAFAEREPPDAASEKATKILLAVLSDRKSNLRSDAAFSLAGPGRLHFDAFPVLKRSLETDPDQGVKLHVTSALLWIYVDSKPESEEAAAQILQALEGFLTGGQEERFRLAVIEKIGAFGLESTLPLLKKVERDSSPAVREAAAKARRDIARQRSSANVPIDPFTYSREHSDGSSKGRDPADKNR